VEVNWKPLLLLYL
jgi:hypothetical protein